MLSGLTLLLICQLIGEVLARVLHLPVPGPVLGLLLLLVIYHLIGVWRPRGGLLQSADAAHNGRISGVIF